MKSKVTKQTILDMHRRGERIVALTAYDYPTARIIDAAGIDLILVGDSLGMVVLGFENTLPVTMEDIIHHTKAVARARTKAMLVADMPFMSYQASVEDAVRNAGRLLKEGGAESVKLEGGSRYVPVIEAIVQVSIPVIGHLGLTPQSLHQFGGYRVQGKDEESAKRLEADAAALARAGCFAIVLEGIPWKLAKRITESISIPTIGIGAGPHCSGQILVIHDLVGIGEGPPPRFVKRYGELELRIGEAVAAYARDVRSGVFPDMEHSYNASGARKGPTDQ